MGALVAAVNRKGENVVSTVVSMLRELTHRGNDSHGIATPVSATTATTIEELELKGYVSSVALGHNLSRILPRDQPQPVQGNGICPIYQK